MGKNKKCRVKGKMKNGFKAGNVAMPIKPRGLSTGKTISDAILYGAKARFFK